MSKIIILALLSFLISCCSHNTREADNGLPIISDTAYVILPLVHDLQDDTNASLETGLLRYNTDLEACRRKVAAIMGDATRDTVDALRKQIRTIESQGTVTLSLSGQDLASTRYAAVRKCLSERGYRAGD